MTTEDRVNNLELQVATVAAKVDSLINEANQQRQDIREMNKKHDADIKELNQKIDSKFDKLSAQIHSMTVAAVVGFGAIVVAVGGLIVAVLK